MAIDRLIDYGQPIGLGLFKDPAFKDTAEAPIVAVPGDGPTRSRPDFPSTSAGHMPRIAIMGTVHKFKRPPKNERQFQGYSPTPSNGPSGGKPPCRRLRDWQKGLLAWLALVLVATAIWGIGRILGGD